jgi:hypothetical protein
MRATSSRGWLLFALALIALGLVLLLQNFLLLGGLSLLTFWPLLLVVVGMAVLLRGDLLAGGAKPFGITRGSVTNATLEVSAGVVDVRSRALPREGRLIAGQFAAGARPALRVEDNHAFLRFDRATTPLLSLADWDLALARDLPWDIRVSTWLGAVDLDLAGLIVQGALVATGFGDIRITCPQEAFTPLTVRSSLGRISLVAPEGVNARVYVQGSRVFRTHFDPERYEQAGEGLFITRNAAAGQPASEFHVSGVFGDCYLG